jgi:BlaI family transcriptional regulator, penicillinase repressor
VKGGLYRIIVSGFGDPAAGVAIIRGDELTGGDSSFYYVGRLSRSAGRISAVIEAVRHSSGPAAAFGPLSRVTLNVSGGFAGEVVRLTGAAAEMPAVSAAVTLSAIKPLENVATPARPPSPRATGSRPPLRGADCPYAPEGDDERGAGPPCGEVARLNQPLTDLHLRLLNLLWRKGEGSVLDLHEALAEERQVATSTIAHALAVMTKRRLVSYRTVVQRHVYRPEVSAEEFVQSIGRTLKLLGETLYQGDREAFRRDLLAAIDDGSERVTGSTVSPIRLPS